MWRKEGPQRTFLKLSMHVCWAANRTSQKMRLSNLLYSGRFHVIRSKSHVRLARYMEHSCGRACSISATSESAEASKAGRAILSKIKSSTDYSPSPSPPPTLFYLLLFLSDSAIANTAERSRPPLPTLVQPNALQHFAIRSRESPARF